MVWPDEMVKVIRVSIELFSMLELNGLNEFWPEVLPPFCVLAWSA